MQLFLFLFVQLCQISFKFKSGGGKLNSIQMIDKKKVIVFVVAFVVVDLVIVIALSKIFMHKDMDTPMDVTMTEPLLEQAQQDPQIELSDEDTTEAIYDVYGLLIIGNFKLGKDLEFNFGSDGSYSGFFDNDNRFVEGYTYQLDNNAGQILVHIYNEDKSRIVTYVMTLSEDTGNIILELPETGNRLELKY